jgi:glycerol-3-phosphate cytidylyltransferase
MVYISGVWDLFHIGHLNVLQRARDLGDGLVVGVVADEFVTEYKGEPPIIPFEDRYAIVRALRCVDAVVTVTAFDIPPCEYDITIRAHGPDYGTYEGQRIVLGKLREMGIRTALIPRTPGISTTIIKERLGNEREANCHCRRAAAVLDRVPV